MSINPTSSGNATNQRGQRQTVQGYVPTVRYGFSPESDKPRQESILRHILDPVPDGAETASPIYLLTPAEYRRQNQLENPYAVRESCIATALQDQCEQSDRVIYPVHIESDTYDDYGPERLLAWYRSFVEDYLGLFLSGCALYFTGSRSIHVHVPLFATTETMRERLKVAAQSFCDETGAELDIGIFSRKRQFRLPGVVHTKTGLSKIRIEPDWNHTEIIRASSQHSGALPANYATVIDEVFGASALTVLEDALKGSDYLLEIAPEASIEAPLVERETPPKVIEDLPEWEAYNRKEFSPYANASVGTGRSVAAVRVEGGAFQREEVGQNRILVPVFFLGAHGCTGKQFTKSRHFSPLQLSNPDYAKWVEMGVKEGEYVVVIGGQSRQSRIFRVTPGQATELAGYLDPDDGSREKALAYLDSLGYDVGKSGSSGSTQPVSHLSRTYARVLPATNPRNQVAELQRQVEQHGVRSVENERYTMFRIASRLLLKYGWVPTWRWFEEQYGDDFDPALTHTELAKIVGQYENLSHISVPTRPE